jgi:hypothetical protein
MMKSTKNDNDMLTITLKGWSLVCAIMQYFKNWSLKDQDKAFINNIIFFIAYSQ